MISASTLLNLSEAFGVIAVGLGATFFSRRASKLSEPTGNGWAKDVVGRLERIEDNQNDLQKSFINHLQAHISAKETS